jgi:hypothetical protein
MGLQPGCRNRRFDRRGGQQGENGQHGELLVERTLL